MKKTLFEDNTKGSILELLPDNFPKVTEIDALCIIVLAVYGKINKQVIYRVIKSVSTHCVHLYFPVFNSIDVIAGLNSLCERKILVCNDYNYSVFYKYIKGVPQKVLSDDAFSKAFAEVIDEFDQYRYMNNPIVRYCFLTRATLIGSVGPYLESINNPLVDLINEQDDFSFIDLDYLTYMDGKPDFELLSLIPLSLTGSDTLMEKAVEWFASLEDVNKELMFFPLLSHFALYANPNLIEILINNYAKSVSKNSEMVKSLTFIVDFLRGDLIDARKKGDLFKTYWNAYKKMRRKEMPFAIGGFYALLLFFSNNETDKKNALTFVRASAKQYKDLGAQLSPGSLVIDLLLEYFTLKQNGGKIRFALMGGAYVKLIWANIIYTWEGEQRGSFDEEDYFFSINSRYKYELKALSGEIKSAEIKKGDMKPMSLLFEPEPEWKEVLEIIEKAANIIPSAKVAKERLVWRVNFDAYDIIPYYQKRQKNGWSKGRNISLRTISIATPPYATETDVQIINQLRRRDGWYSGVEYVWLYDECFPLFVNHPLLFTTSDPMLPVTLTQEDVGFIIKDTKDGMQIRLTHEIGTDILKEGERTYKYLNWDNTVAKTAMQMDNKNLNVLTFPKEAKERTKEALVKLSQRISISGDFDDPNLITKKANIDLVLRINPFEDGIIATILIKPLADEYLTLIPGVGSSSVTIKSKDGNRIQINRSIKRELKALNELKESVASLREMEDNKIEILGELDVLNFLADIREFGSEITIEWPNGERFKVIKVASMKDVNIDITSSTDWFEVNGKIKINEDKTLSIKQLLEASEGGNKAFIKLDDNLYFKLKKDLQKRLVELSAIGQGNKEKVKIHRLGANTLSDIISDAGKLKTDKKWKDNLKEVEKLRNFVPQMPNNLHAQLRPYQLDGYNWLSRLHAWGVGACLADDMGLGKTIQAMALLLEYANNGPSLVIAPSSVCANWLKEMTRFAPSLNGVTLKLQNRKQVINELKEMDVLVVSYGLIQSNPDLLADKDWNITILDEGHAIKNSNSIRSKAAMKIKSKFKLITTGTPIQNHLGELWNLFQFLNPGFLGSYDSFNARFVNGDSEQDIMSKRKALNAYIAPFILRRNKSDVLDDLPGKTEVTLTVEQTENEKALYEALRQRAVENIEEKNLEKGFSHMEILAQISKLRLASCNPRLVEGGNNMISSKMNALEELVVDLISSKHKALVFSQFTKHLALIKEMLDTKKISYQYLDGSMNVKQREKAILNFQSGKSDLFLISLKAGGVGLNLTAADYVIHMDPWWNPAIEDQASDRAHRIGQKRPVTVYRLVSEGTIEEKIVKLHHKKRNLADQLLANTDKSAKISSTELFELIQ